MFQLKESEFKSLISQFAISNRGGTRKLPFVFTEQGVAMLLGILNSDRAIAVNIQIMRIFTRVRQMLTDNTELRLDIEKIKKKLDNQDKNMEIVFRYLDELLEKKENTVPRTKIGYKMPKNKLKRNSIFIAQNLQNHYYERSYQETRTHSNVE